MPRLARVVIPEVLHHVTQRGTGRQLVFYTRGDRWVYLRFLRANSARAGLRDLGCLMMPNHIHLIAVPATAECMGDTRRISPRGSFGAAARGVGVVQRGGAWGGRRSSAGGGAGILANGGRSRVVATLAARSGLKG
jgi:putative transposase